MDEKGNDEGRKIECRKMTRKRRFFIFLHLISLLFPDAQLSIPAATLCGFELG
jgi:hypothetical protein